MSYGISEAAAIQIAGGVVRPGVIFRMDTSPVVRLWAGAGPLPISADNVETTASTYQGTGTLVGVPALQALINGIAERVEFTLSGAAVTGEVLRLADEEADDVRGAQVNIGLVLFDAAWQAIAGAPLWLWQGEADTPRLARVTDDKGNVSRAVTISVGSAFTDRKRPPLAYYTDVDQRRRSGDDAFCERTPLYNMQVSKPWPRL